MKLHIDPPLCQGHVPRPGLVPGLSARLAAANRPESARCLTEES